MATNADWTVIFDDKVIIKRTGSDQGSYIISNDDSFWSQDKWSNIWAIQYKDDNHDYNDSVEHRDETPHATWAASELGDFNSQFISRWDAAHLAKIQSNWDNDNAEGETEAEKIARLGERPTSYSSS